MQEVVMHSPFSSPRLVQKKNNTIKEAPTKTVTQRIMEEDIDTSSDEDGVAGGMSYKQLEALLAERTEENRKLKDMLQVDKHDGKGSTSSSSLSSVSRNASLSSVSVSKRLNEAQKQLVRRWVTEKLWRVLKITTKEVLQQNQHILASVAKILKIEDERSFYEQHLLQLMMRGITKKRNNCKRQVRAAYIGMCTVMMRKSVKDLPPILTNKRILTDRQRRI